MMTVLSVRLMRRLERADGGGGDGGRRESGGKMRCGRITSTHSSVVLMVVVMDRVRVVVRNSLVMVMVTRYDRSRRRCRRVDGRNRTGRSAQEILTPSVVMLLMMGLLFDTLFQLFQSRIGKRWKSINKIEFFKIGIRSRIDSDGF